MAVKSTLAVLICLGSAWLLHVSLRLYKSRRRFKGLPQPPHSFLWGHIKVMGEAVSTMPPNVHPQAYLTAIAQKYNLRGIFYIDLWPIADPQVILIDPDLMNQVTVNKPLAQHSLADDFMAPVIGRNNIASSNGAIWKKTHNAMAPAFSWSHIRNLSGIITEETMHFRHTLDKLARSGEVFSMEETSAKLIFDIIARIVFNVPLHAQTKGSLYLNDIRAMIHMAEVQFSWNPFVKALNFVRRHVILRRLNSSIERQIRQRLSLLRHDNIIPSRKDPYSILDLMLREEAQDDPKQKGRDTEDIPREDLDLLVTNIKALLVGGHGTTTDTICYIYMLLSKHPEVVRKMREEHSRVFHENFTETLNILLDAPQKIAELEYTTAVIKETLRLFPVGYGVRVAEQGATVTYNETQYPIDGHIVVVVTPHTLHYDPYFFPEPDKFKPERFMDPEDNMSRTYFRTFGRGPRACLGQNLAQEELRLILLMTIREYDFECAGLKPNKTPRVKFSNLDTIYGDIVFQELGLDAKPRGGMMMTVKKRV